jgi:hypothetical protein
MNAKKARMATLIALFRSLTRSFFAPLPGAFSLPYPEQD